ncbi:hypothetical protein [Microbacterium maritypicum]
MTGTDIERRDWRSEFSTTQLATMRVGLPEGINSAQVRTSRAHKGYEDPDDHQHLYGIGMAYAAAKDCRQRLRELIGYSERPVPRSSRVTMHVGPHLIHVQRVGAQMPRNNLRIRLKSLSEARRERFEKASSDTYAQRPATLFDLPRSDDEQPVATWDDVAQHAAEEIRTGSLFVAYFSSTPEALGQMYLAPAQLAGNYLEFADPEPLIFRRTGQTTSSTSTKSTQTARVFAGGERPRTITKFRDD